MRKFTCYCPEIQRYIEIYNSCTPQFLHMIINEHLPLVRNWRERGDGDVDVLVKTIKSCIEQEFSIDSEKFGAFFECTKEPGIAPAELIEVYRKIRGSSCSPAQKELIRQHEEMFANFDLREEIFSDLLVPMAMSLEQSFPNATSYNEFFRCAEVEASADLLEIYNDIKDSVLNPYR